jgi:hypothetical protein
MTADLSSSLSTPEDMHRRSKTFWYKILVRRATGVMTMRKWRKDFGTRDYEALEAWNFFYTNQLPSANPSELSQLALV